MMQKLTVTFLLSVMLVFARGQGEESALSDENVNECPPTEHYEECGSACAPTCDNLDSPEMCAAVCVARCFCNANLFRNSETGSCVPLKMCPGQGGQSGGSGDGQQGGGQDGGDGQQGGGQQGGGQQGGGDGQQGGGQDGGDGQQGNDDDPRKCEFGTPAVDENDAELFCGRGLERVDCPSGYSCSVHPTDIWAVCCPSGTPDPQGTEEPTRDMCGGCAHNEMCIDNGIRCVTTPCPSPYQCVPKPKPQATCCAPNQQGGVNGNPIPTEGETCCSTGEWTFNNVSGESQCERLGEVCACCSEDTIPSCPYGSTCCSNGSWRCTGEDGESRCDEEGWECTPCLSAEEPQNCEHGTTCCSNGSWMCDSTTDVSTCIENGEVSA